MIDDVLVNVARSDNDTVVSGSRDYWSLNSTMGHSGSYSWWCGDPGTNNLTGGIDNSLTTIPIDLTNALSASLSAYFKFNINTSGGRPPDGFRLEVSSDNGVTWKSINLGVRCAWGVSGTEGDVGDGTMDGKSYTGIDTEGDNWVESSTLTRLNTDLTPWLGKVVLLRFRAVTASDHNPYFQGTHWADPNAGFGGIFVDDIVISGYSSVGDAGTRGYFDT